MMRRKPSLMDQMTILGLKVTLCWERNALRLELLEEKAARWLQVMDKALAGGVLTQRNAEKLVGRLVWTACMIASRLGRAMLKPLYAQSTHPFRGGKISPWLARALEWWIVFVHEMPKLERSLVSTQTSHIVCWADASGASRLVAAVAFLHPQKRDLGPHNLASTTTGTSAAGPEDLQIQAQ